MNKQELYSNYNDLLWYAQKNGIPFEVAEEMVDDVLLKAIDSYDSERGLMRSFCYGILKNRILNFHRDRKDYAYFNEEDGQHGKSVQKLRLELQESEELMKKMFKRIAHILDADELSFLNELRSVTEQSEEVLVSEAARRLNLTPQKGWDLFRRIQRKAKKDPILKSTATDVGSLDEAEWVMPREMSKQIAPSNSQSMWIPEIPAPSSRDVFRIVASLGIISGFKDFYNSLDPEKRSILDQLDFSK